MPKKSISPAKTSISPAKTIFFFLFSNYSRKEKSLSSNGLEACGTYLYLNKKKTIN